MVSATHIVQYDVTSSQTYAVIIIGAEIHLSTFMADVRCS
jgi:hypothetical protein